MTAEQFVIHPTSSHCYSGGLLKIKSRCVTFDHNRIYVIVFEDDNVRYFVGANVLNVLCLCCIIPAVSKPCSTTVKVLAISKSGEIEQLFKTKFAFTPDPIDPLAAYLAKNANCLDCDISVIEKVGNGIQSNFDSALSVALSCHDIEIDSSQHTPRLTLVHLIAHLGFQKTLNRLLVSLPGSLELLNLKAPNGFSPVDLADGEMAISLSKLTPSDVEILKENELSPKQFINGYPMMQDDSSSDLSESIVKFTNFCEEVDFCGDDIVIEPSRVSVSPGKDSTKDNKSTTGSLFTGLIDQLYNAVTATSEEGDKLQHSRSFSDLHENEEPSGSFNEQSSQGRRDSGSSIGGGIGVRRRNSLPTSTQRPGERVPSPAAQSASAVVTDDDDKPNWSEWCSENHPALFSSMTSRQRKLQDSIWEFIRTESHHLRILSLMDRIYRRPLRDEFNMDSTTLNTLFPHLSDLIEEHSSFLTTLRSRQKERLDRQIHAFSDILLIQFTGEHGAAFSNLYAQFILHQYQAKRKYDELYVENKVGFFLIKYHCLVYFSSMNRNFPLL